MGMKVGLNGWKSLYRSMFLLPRHNRESIEDVRMLELENADDDDDSLSNAQDPNWAKELEGEDPFAMADEMDKSIPVNITESSEGHKDDPFRDVSLFRVGFFIS